VDGYRATDPNDTGDAGSIRPIYSKRAMVIGMLPELTRTASGFRLSDFPYKGADRQGKELDVSGGVVTSVTGLESSEADSMT
jgi:hypothetical protein